MRFEGGYHIAAHTSGEEEAPPDDGGGAAAPFQGNGVLGMYPPDYVSQRRRRVEHADLIARCILQPGPPAAAAVAVPHGGRFLVSRRLAEVPVREDGTRYVRDEARLDMMDASSTATFSAYEATGGGAFLARLEGRALCPRHLPHCTLQSLELSPVFSSPESPVVLHHGITLPPDAHARALAVEYETFGDEFVCRVRSSPTSRTVTLARYVWEAPARFRTLGFAGRDGATGFNRILVHPPPAADEEGAAVRFHVLTHTTVATGPGVDDEPLVRSARATLDAALALGPGDDGARRAVAAIREQHNVLWGRAWERGNIILEGRVPPALGGEDADDGGRGAGGDDDEEEEEEAYRSLLRVHLLQQRLRFALYNVLCGTSLAGLLLLAAGDGAPLLLREDDETPYSPGESGPLVQRWFLETHWVLPLLEGVAPRAAVRASLRRTYRRIVTHVLEAQRTGAVSIPHPDMGYWAHDDGPALTPAALLCVALWDHLRATRDTQWLADAGFPMLASLADGLAAGVLRGEEEEEEPAGGWNDLRVRAVATGLCVAQEAAALLGITGAGVEAWRRAEEGLVRLELLRAGSGGGEAGGEASSAPRAVLAWAALQPRLRPVTRWEARREQVRRIRAALAAPHLRDAATAPSVRGWHDTHRVFALAWEAELQGELARELADTVEIQDGGGRRPARRVAARGADRVLAALEAMEAAMSAMGRGGAGPRGALDAGNLQLEPGRAGRGNDTYASALLLATFFSAVCGLRQEGGIARTGLHRRLAYAPVGPAVRSGKTAALSEALARVGLSGLLRLRT